MKPHEGAGSNKRAKRSREQEKTLKSSMENGQKYEGSWDPPSFGSLITSLWTLCVCNQGAYKLMRIISRMLSIGCSQLKAVRPHTRNYPHTPTDYRHTDILHFKLVMTLNALYCTWTHLDWRTLPSAWSPSFTEAMQSMIKMTLLWSPRKSCWVRLVFNN